MIALIRIKKGVFATTKTEGNHFKESQTAVLVLAHEFICSQKLEDKLTMLAIYLL